MADPPPVLTLLVQKGPCKGETRRGRAGAALRVGRVAKGNHLAVRDAGASQSHLSVEFLKPPAARWAVTDLGSSNGTLLNGAALVPTVPAPLSDGDLIKIGESTVLAVSIAADEGTAPAPSATRRSARNAAAAAAAEEEQAPVVTRGAGRKKAAAPEAEMEMEEAVAVPTRRGGRKKATAPTESEKEVKGEAAVPTRRGGRRKAVDPPEVETEEEEEEAAVPPRGGRKKAAEPPDAEKEVNEEAAVPTRRGGRRKAVEPPEVETEEEEEAAVPPRGGQKRAAEPPDAEKEVKEEAAVPTRRGGRRKAVEPPEVEMEEEEEEAAVRPRGGRRKAAAAAALPPKPQSTRSTRAAARRGDAVRCGNDEVERTGRGRRPATRASAKKATHAVPEEDEEEEEVPVTRDQVGNPPTATGVKGGEEEDTLEITRDGTSNTSEEVPGAGRGHAKSTRGGRRRAPSTCKRKDDDAVIEVEDEKEQEESDMADGRGSRGSPQKVMAANDGGEEVKVATGDDKLDRTSKASIEDEKMVDVEEDAPLAPKERAIEGRISAQLATANNGSMEQEERRDLSRGGEDEVADGVGEVEETDKREAISHNGEEGPLEGDLSRGGENEVADGVGEVEETDKREAISHNGEEGPVEGCPLRSSLENMTLGEWFIRIEKYLLAKNEEAAEKAIALVQEKHQRFCEHLKMLNKSSDPS